MLLIHILMESWLKNVWFLDLNGGNMLLQFSRLVVLLLFIKFWEWDFLFLVLLEDIFPKILLFAEILIWGDLISLSIVINITWGWVDWRPMIFRGRWLKSMSQHCLIHLVLNDISTLLLSIIFVLWGYYLLETFWYLVRFFGCVVLLFFLLNHQRWLLTESIFRNAF